MSFDWSVAKPGNFKEDSINTELGYLMRKHGLIPLTKHPAEGFQKDKSNRPSCSVPGCDNLAVNYSNKKGFYKWRRASWIKEHYPEADNIWCCSKCHNAETARRNGVKSAHHLTAQRHGLTLTEYHHRNHPYLKHRKDYCENRDGRLGFVCTFTHPTPDQLESTGLDATFLGWLQVDHKDGNHTNNDPSNLQTLCACCHNVKTYQNGDNATPGRKTREKEVDFF
jgi:cytochrome c553